MHARHACTIRPHLWLLAAVHMPHRHAPDLLLQPGQLGGRRVLVVHQILDCRLGTVDVLVICLVVVIVINVPTARHARAAACAMFEDREGMWTTG